jgi:hypothetical protein
MPKINNNPIMKGVSGMLGGVVVYRQFRGMTIMSNRPKKAKVMTPHQQAIKSRFLLAVEFAKRQMADPVLKAKYEPGPDSEFASAYIAAVTDYLRSTRLSSTGRQKTNFENVNPVEPTSLNMSVKVCVINSPERLTRTNKPKYLYVWKTLSCNSSRQLLYPAIVQRLDKLYPVRYAQPPPKKNSTTRKNQHERHYSLR